LKWREVDIVAPLLLSMDAFGTTAEKAVTVDTGRPKPWLDRRGVVD
jgi:hypothetical protein